MPCKTFIPRGIFTFAFLNLENENFNDEADRCLKATSQSRVYMLRREGRFVWAKGGKKRWTSHFVPEPSPSLLTHPFTEASKPLNSWRGRRWGRRKETGNRRGKEKGQGILSVYINPTKKNPSTQ